jgi:hypothetical protein
MRSRRGRRALAALAALGAWSDEVGLVQQSSSHAVSVRHVGTQARRLAVGQSSSKQGTTAGSWQRALARRLLFQVRRDGGPWRAPKTARARRGEAGGDRLRLRWLGLSTDSPVARRRRPGPKAGPLPTDTLGRGHEHGQSTPTRP